MTTTPHMSTIAPLKDPELDFNWYVGLVKDNNDPEKLGRLKIMVPELYGNMATESLPWANPMFIFGGGKDFGIPFIPPNDTKVFVQFWKGHRWQPLWSGSHYFQGEMPTEAQKDYPKSYVIKTPQKQLIELNDKTDFIKIKDHKGNYIVIDTSGDTLDIKINEDVLIESGENMNITVGGTKRQQIGAQYDITVIGAVNLRASDMVNIDGLGINLNAGLAMPQTPDKPNEPGK